jgi:predicted transcriptional regulator
METPKQQALVLIQRLADDATWEQIEYAITLNATIERSEADIAAGRVIPHEQVEAEMEEWLASLGQRQPAKASTAS